MNYGVIDPGHYKKYNQGVIKEYYESVSNLTFAKKLKTRLESTGRFKIILTRYDENDLSLTSRGLMAKDKDFFLSIHSDSAANTTGSLVIDSVDLKTEDFALKLASACARGYGIPSKGYREREYKNTGEDYYTVIDKAQDIGCPLVHLLERANHSNESDCKKLLNDELENKAVEEVAMVYEEYFKNRYTNEEIQEKLKEKGFYKDKIDGSLGHNSKIAIKNFQSSVSLKSTGVVDNETLTKLFESKDYKALYEAAQTKLDKIKEIL